MIKDTRGAAFGIFWCRATRNSRIPFRRVMATEWPEGYAHAQAGYPGVPKPAGRAVPYKDAIADFWAAKLVRQIG
jgi:hypothetical protein